MKLKNAATFLFIASIISIIGDLVRHGYFFSNYGPDMILGLSGIYLLITVLVAILFLLLGLSYSRPSYNPESRKMLGIFTAVVGGGWILLKLYTLFLDMNRGWLSDAPLEYLSEHLVFLFSAITMLILGIALASKNPRQIRSAMLLMIISSGMQTLMELYMSGRMLIQYGLPDSFADILLQLTAILQITFPVAQFFWAMAAYKRLGEKLNMQNERSVTDQLD